MTSRIPNILTIDVEDWFHILESDDAPDRAAWDTLPARVEANTERLLALLAEADVTATCFVVGWVAERFPGLVRKMVEAGHEIASHSYWHEVVRRHDRASLAADLGASRQLLEDISGCAVEGFRAPGNSITPADAWAFDVICQAGFTYDASVCPTGSSHGGFEGAPLGPHIIRCDSGDLVEIPSATTGIGSLRVPYAGGGYLRLFPGFVLRAAIALDNSRGRPTNVYVHPREIDVDQPRMDLPPLRKFKYYVGLASTEKKLRALLSRYRWIGARAWIAERRPELIGHLLDVRELARSTEPRPDPRFVPPRPEIATGSAGAL